MNLSNVRVVRSYPVFAYLRHCSWKVTRELFLSDFPGAWEAKMSLPD